MVFFGLLHLLSAVAGIGGTLGLLLGGTERTGQLASATWVGLVGVAGTGLVLTLSGVGAGDTTNATVLLGKVILTIGLGGLTVVTIPPGDIEQSPDRARLGVMLVCWVALFGLGGLMVL